MSSTTRKGDATLTERLLQEARDAHRPVSIYLVSGFQMKGDVVDFDHEAVLFKHKNVHQLIMRSGVASMFPLPNANRGEGDWWREYVPTTAGEEPPTA